MKKILVTAAIILFAVLGNVSYANGINGDSKIKITEVKHEYYKNVLQINISSEEQIMYVFLKNPEGEILYGEKIKNNNFIKKFSLNVAPEDLEANFTFEVVYEKATIKYEFNPNQLFSKKK